MIVASSQYNFVYGSQVHYPYSVACVISAARAAGVPMTLLPTAVQRDLFAEHVERFAAADVLLCSCYVWNWEITNALARAVKERNPRCVVVFGGPQVPDAPGAEWYEQHAWVDACVHGEGEEATAHLLHGIALRANAIFEPSAGQMPLVRSAASVTTPSAPILAHRRPRLQLDDVPSPYLDGTIDELAEPLREGRHWIAVYETNRGCPFQCSFCFAADTLVALPDRVVRFGDETFSGDTPPECDHIHRESMNDPRLVYHGRHECVAVELSNGTSVTPTRDHPMCVIDNDEIVERRAADLHPGDWVPLQIGQNAIHEQVPLPVIDNQNINWHRSRAGRLHPRTAAHLVELPSTLTESLAWVLGYFVGNGSITKGDKAVRFCVPTARIAEVVEKFTETFGVSPRIDSVGRATQKAKHVSLSSRTVVRFLTEALGMRQSGDAKLRVPQAILRSPASVVRAFLGGLWAADGYVPRSVQPPYLTTVSHVLAQEVAALIHWIGDTANIYQVDTRKYRPHAPFNIRLAYRVEWHPRASRDADACSGAARRAAEIPLSFGLTPTLAIVPTVNWNGRKRGTVPRARLRRFDPTHRLLADDLSYVQVKTVTPAGEHDVYDAMNAPTHLLAANGALAANCDWGSSTYTKLRQYPIERLNAEIEWFGARQIPYVDCCDANFGILPRDLDIARKLRETKERTGYPRTFRQSWTKNSTAKVIPIAKELHDGGLLTAAGLALESLDDATLKATKRKNLPFDKYADLSKQFADAGLPTYTELIRGLPGETLHSFIKGLNALIDDAHIGQIYVYNCSVLPNAPMADPAYLAKHGIKTVRSPIYLAHSAVNSTDIQEYEDIVTETATMPRADMEQACLYSWAVALGESLGLCDQLSTWYARPHGATRIAFYGALLTFCQGDGARTVLGDEYRRAAEHARRGYDGDGWGEYAPELGEILWPIEEASWLTLVGLRRDDTCLALSGFLRSLDHREPMRAAVAQIAQLEQFDGDDFAAWARDMMWYGRRSQRFRRTGIRKAA